MNEPCKTCGRDHRGRKVKYIDHYIEASTSGGYLYHWRTCEGGDRLVIRCEATMDPEETARKLREHWLHDASP